MSILRTEVLPFKAKAFKDGDFIDVTEADLHGKWLSLIHISEPTRPY